MVNLANGTALSNQICDYFLNFIQAKQIFRVKSNDEAAFKCHDDRSNYTNPQDQDFS